MPRRPHLAPVVRKRIADLADHRLGRAHGKELHEVDLVRVNVERDIGKELVIEPLALITRRQVIDRWEIALIRPLGRIGRFLLDQIAFHPVYVRLRFDPVVASEQPRQARMTDRNVQMV